MKTLRAMLFGLAVVVLAVLGWRLTASVPHNAVDAPPVASGEPVAPPPPKITASLSQASPPETAPLSQARGSVERRLAEVPQYAAFFTALGTAFPAVRDRLLDQWAERLTKSGVLASPESLLWQAMRDIQQSRGLLAKRAGDAALTSYFDARLALLDAMAPADPKLCADFLYGTTDTALDAFSAAHPDLVANLAERQLAALSTGRDNGRDPMAPTSADLDLVAAALATKGLSGDEVGMLLDGRMLDPSPTDGRLCDMGRIYLSVLRALPADARARVYGLAAELLARS